MSAKGLSLRFKLFFGLAIVAVASMVAIYFTATHSLLGDVKAFLVSENIALLSGVKERLSRHYAENGGWEGVDLVFTEHTSRSWQGVEYGSQSNEPGRFQWGENVLLADLAGNVVYASSLDLEREGVLASVLPKGIPILVGDEEVGRLYTGAMLDRFTSLEASLLVSVRRSVAVTAGVTLFAAIAVSFLLLSLVTAPFGRLIKATRKISSGDLTHPVVIETHDAIGELSHVLDDLRVSLDRSEKLRHAMLADIAHELRNPLAILRVKVEGMLDGLLQVSEENLGSVSEKLHHLSHLVDELQDIALAEADELPLDLEPIDLPELLRVAAQDARALMSDEEKALDLELPESLPRVLADRRRLLQIVWNLLSNASRHTSAGSTITVQVEHHSGHLIIHVVDTGEGMDEETAAHVFDRFYRADRTTVSGGLGLGLAITQELVRAHGGEIWVESRPAEGATFSFSMPTHCP